MLKPTACVAAFGQHKRWDGSPRFALRSQEPLLTRVQAVTTRPLKLDAVRPEYHRATLHWRPGADGTAGGRTRSCRSHAMSRLS